MCSPGINGEGELRGQPANPGSPGKISVYACPTFRYEMSPEVKQILLYYFVTLTNVNRLFEFVH